MLDARPAARPSLLLALAGLSAASAACPSAPVAPERRPLDRAALVGVFTTSTAGCVAAEASSDAARLAGDGTLERGRWSPAERRFEPAPPRHEGSVDRWTLDPTTGTLRFALDGAEEEVPVALDGADRWRTIYDGPDGHIEVCYVRVAGP